MSLASRRSTKSTALLAALCCFTLIPDSSSARGIHVPVVYYSDGEGGEGSTTYEEGDGEPMSAGAVIGIVLAVLAQCYCAWCLSKNEDDDGTNGAGSGRTVAPNPDIENPSPVFVKAVAHKDSASSNVGITFTKKGDKVVISQIEEDSIFGDKGLTLGMAVVSINGVSCPPNLREAIALVRPAEGDLSILALSIPNQSSS